MSYYFMNIFSLCFNVIDTKEISCYEQKFRYAFECFLLHCLLFASIYCLFKFLFSFLKPTFPTTTTSVLFCSLYMLLSRSLKCMSKLRMNTLLVYFSNAVRPSTMYILTINSLRCLVSLKRGWRMLRWVEKLICLSVGYSAILPL